MPLRGLTLKMALRHRRQAIPIALLAPLLPPRQMPSRPIFVIGCSRSGTSIVFWLLRHAPGLCSIGAEGHPLWETFHHPRAKGWRSNALDAEDVGSVERRYVAWAVRLLAGRGRFVDKTPDNALRLPYIEALFPDATYVFVHRDGRAVVSSLFENWGRRRHPHPLPHTFAVQGMPRGWWRFPLIDGWQEFNGRPLEEVCAEQYVQSVEALLDFRDRLPQGRFVDIRYEELLADPVARTQDMFSGLDVPFPDEYADFVRKFVRPGGRRGSNTPPGREKWEMLHADEIERVLPRIRPTMERDGYPV